MLISYPLNLRKNLNKSFKILFITVSPYSGKKLVGDLAGFYSIRLSYQDRILYTINDEQKLIYIHRAKTHYGE